MNIQQSLKISTKELEQKNIPSSALDAEVLLLEALNRDKPHSHNSNVNDIKHEIAASLCGAPRNDSKKLSKSWLYINNEYVLSKKEEKLFNSFVNQRLKNKPVAYIISKKEFYGYDFYVDKDVLIPRPETEIIVEEVLKILNRKENSKNKINLIDIGTGSGCIMISILNELAKNKNDKVIHSAYANDISCEAIKIAKINSEKYNLSKKIKFIKNDFEFFLDNLNKKNIYNSDELIITANLPYIKNDGYKNLSVSVKKYEPKVALIAGKDGLAYIKKLIGHILKIKKKRKQKIYVFIEADPDQMSKIRELFGKNFNDTIIKIIRDLSQKDRVISIKI
jgi:release factor glutamine methyltransferase